MISFLSSLNGALPIEKWHGARNDFIFVEAGDFVSVLADAAKNLSISSVAIELCNRNSGLGADGLVLWSVNQSGDLSAGIWNSDGSRAGTCGNALRCLAASSFERKLWDGKSPRPVFELLLDGQQMSCGVPFATLRESALAADAQPGSFTARVDMGCVVEYRKIPRGELARAAFMGGTVAQELLLSGLASVSYVKLANPHLVLVLMPMVFQKFTPEHFNELGVVLQSEALCQSLNIPVSNIGFVELRHETQKDMEKPLNAVVFERGAGLTQCCGSGGCAMKVALEKTQNSQAGQPESFAMPGGVISIHSDGENLQLSGPAQRICRISIH